MKASPAAGSQRAVRAVVGVGLVAVLVALAAILTESKPRQAGSNYVRDDTLIARLAPGERACQRNEVVPEDAGRLRLLVRSSGGPLPTLRLTLASAGRSVVAGTLRGGGRGGHVSVPVGMAPPAGGPTTVCLENVGARPAALFGSPSPDPMRISSRASRGPTTRATPGRLRFEWLRSGSESWLELLPALARRVGYAKANPFGSALIGLVGVLVVVSWALALASMWRPRPTPYWCAIAAAASCLAWSQLIPPFQVPDETVHFSYAQLLAETGRAPYSPSAPSLSPQQSATMGALRTTAMIGYSRNRGPLTAADSAAVTGPAATSPSPVGGGVNEATSQPPLYYLLEAGAYRLSPSASVVGRLLAMRLVSCLLAGLTVAFVFLFLKQVLPRQPWAWSVGALAAAFQPMFGFISSGVSSDAALYCASAALFWALARAFREGLRRRTAVAIGLALAAGMLSKLTFLGLVPGALLGVVFLVLRMPAERRGEATRRAGLALAIAAVPIAVYVAVNLSVWDRPALAGSLQGVAAAAGTAGEAATVGGWRQQLGYVWQLYLPKLPFMFDQFTYDPLRSTWINGATGSFGWLDYGFRAWVYRVSELVALAGALLAAAGFVRWRRALSTRRQEVLCYTAILLGLLVEIGLLGVRYRAATGYIFEQARYLMPLLAVYGGLVAVGALAVGRRFAPALGAAIVLAALFHSLASQLLTISRYYG